MLLQDMRYAFRQLRKSPGFALTAILTLALGIGVNAAMFTLTYAILLKSLPVPNPGRLIRYSFKKTDMDLSISGPLYDALRRHQTASTDLLAWSNVSLVAQENGNTVPVNAALMSGNGFSVLGVEPSLGRVFGEAGDVSGGGPAGYQAVLNYDYWNTHFHGDRSVIGKGLLLNGRSVTILGVLPRGFNGLVSGRADMVLPLSFAEIAYPQKDPYRNAPGNFWLTVMGRLQPERSIKTAQSNLQAILPQVYAEADPQGRFLNGYFKSFTLGVESGRAGRSALRIGYSRPLILLELLSALLLTLCCTNIALLVLARVSGRQHEFALRSALGASNSRLIGQVLLESVSFVPLGLIAGLVVGAALARALAAMLGGIGSPSTLDASLNPTVLIFSAGIALATALLAGLWPALRVRRLAPAANIRHGNYSARSSMTGSWIIPVQVAISVTLLVSALLLGSTFARLYLEPSGFQGRQLVFADVDISAAKLNADHSSQVVEALLAGLRSSPGIESAALMSMAPLRGNSASADMLSYDRHGVKHADPESWPEYVSPGYFETMGTNILAGRALSSSDRPEDRVCVLSRSAAEFFFPGEDAVGRFIYDGEESSGKAASTLDPKKAWRVIGIAQDAHFFSLRSKADRILYKPLSQEKEHLGLGSYTAVMRTGNATVAATGIHDVFHRVAPPNSPQPTVYTYADLLDSHLQRERILILLSTSFAGIALVLVAVGLFGILTRSVSLRTREIGIRMALGERRSSVIRKMLLSSLRLVAVGVVIGSFLAYAGSRLLQALLYQTSIGSPWVYVAAGALLFATAALATILPANRAASIEPGEALRME
jgi:predicted permease